MNTDGIFMAKSADAAVITMTDPELEDYLTLHHEEDLTKLIMNLQELGVVSTGELTIPDVNL